MTVRIIAMRWLSSPHIFCHIFHQETIYRWKVNPLRLCLWDTLKGSDINLSAPNARRFMRLTQVNFPAFTPSSHTCLRILEQITSISVNNNKSSSLLPLTALTIRSKDKTLIKVVTMRIQRTKNKIMSKLFTPQDIQRQRIASVIQTRKWSTSAKVIKHSSVLDASSLILAMGILYRSVAWISTVCDLILLTSRVSIKDWSRMQRGPRRWWKMLTVNLAICATSKSINSRSHIRAWLKL